MGSFRAVQLPIIDEHLNHPVIDKALDGLMSFSGGVILATIFIDIIPHVDSIYSKSRDQGIIETNFPLSHFLMCVGLLLAFLIEEGSLQILNKRKKSQKHKTVNVLLTAVVFALALSVHSFIEGFTLLQDTTSRVTELMLALLLFKMIEGVSVYEDPTHAARDKLISLVTAILVFALMIPTGSAIGALINTYELPDEEKQILILIAESIAAGILLYIAFFEIIYPQQKQSRLITLTLSLLGFLIVAALHFFFGTIRLRAAGGQLEEEYPEYFEP